MPAASSSKRAAGLRLGLDQLADAALPDHGGRAGAGRLVGEEQLHILGAGVLAVDLVGGAGLALDAAGDLQQESSWLKAAGAVRSELSRNRETSAVLREGRVPEPEKITSSMPDARMFL